MLKVSSANPPVTELSEDSKELEGLLDRTVSSPGSSGQLRQDAASVGTLLGFLEPSVPLVAYRGQPTSAAVPARLATDLDERHLGSEVVLQFEEGDPARPIVIGHIRKPSTWPLSAEPAQVRVDADGHSLVVDAKDQLTLRCGSASITLTKAGKVLIKGTYVLSHSSGVNRIKGGSVQVN